MEENDMKQDCLVIPFDNIVEINSFTDGFTTVTYSSEPSQISLSKRKGIDMTVEQVKEYFKKYLK